MVATLAAWDLLIAGLAAAAVAAVRGRTCPSSLMTGGVSGAALSPLRAGRARERAQRRGAALLRAAVRAPPRACRRRRRDAPASRPGRLLGGGGGRGVVAAAAAAAAAQRRRRGAARCSSARCGGSSAWRRPRSPGYESPRHVYLAAAGWAIVLGILADLAWPRARTSAAGVSSSRRRARRAGVLRRRAAPASSRSGTAWRRCRIRPCSTSAREVLRVARADAGHRRRSDAQLGVGRAVLGPPAIHPHRPDPAGVHHHALAAALLPRPVVRRHAAHPARLARRRRAPIVVLRWDPDTGALSKVTEREYPALRTVADVLLQLDSREALDANILRMVQELPVPVDPAGARERR